MKHVLFVMSILFGILCLAGAGYVLYTHGQANAGYAVVPMLFSIILSQGYLALKKKDRKE